MNPSIAQRIQRAKAAMQANQDARYQRTTRTALATVTSVNRDPISGYTDGTVWAAIDGVSDQRIFIGAGTGVQQGDTLRVENRSGPLSPDWVLVGKVGTSAGAEGLVDIDRVLSTPTGLTLVSAAYTPTPGNLSARLTATWNQIGDWEGVRLYEAQLRRDADSTIHTSSVGHVNGDATASVTWGELFQGIDYSVRVRAVGYGGSVGGWTSWSSATTSTDSTAPATPSGLAAVQVDERTLRATWTANTEADLWYYQIDVGLDGSASLGGIYPRGTGTTPQHLIATQPTAPRYFRVRAVDTSGNASAWSGWSGPHTTVERPSLAGLIYLTPKAELIANLSSVAGSMDVTVAVYDSGEFVHILTSDGATEEIVKVTSGATTITGGHRYTISRAADGGTAQAFDAGTPAYTLGKRGYILADSRDDGSHTDTPFLDIFAHDDPYTGTWANREHKVRLGKLDGITDATMGSLNGFGLYSTNAYLIGRIEANAGSLDSLDISGTLTIDGGEIVDAGGAYSISETGISFDAITGKFGGPTLGWKDGAATEMTMGPEVDLGGIVAAILESRTDLYLRSTAGAVVLSPAAGQGASVSNGGGLAPLSTGALTATTISTDGGTNKWTLAGYTASAPTATGYVSVTINGTAYKLIAAT